MSLSQSSSTMLEADVELDEDSLQRWVVAFCVARFDLEKGQLLEECYPPNSLNHNEELGVSFSSFPDSVSHNQNRSGIRDCMFFFRIKRHEDSQGTNISSSEILKLDNDKSLDASVGKKELKLLTSKKKGLHSKYLYGFVFNRQTQDERLKRGGEQKSVIVLSHSPFSSVFRPLLQILGPLYFEIGKKALVYVGACVSKWPDPEPGKLMELLIGKATLKTNLPPAHSLPLNEALFPDEVSSPIAPYLPTNESIPQGLFHDSDIFGIFRGLLMQLWRLWELLLIGEPILIIAPTPPQCCEAVASLVSLIAPLFYSVDFRPYFTIHDPEFGYLNSLQEGSIFPPMVLGVTNLFFLKSLRSIPHILSVGSYAPNSSRTPFASGTTNGRTTAKNEALGPQNLSLKKFSPSKLLDAVKLKRDGPLSLMTAHREAIWSSYVAVTKPDTTILNRLINVGMSPRSEESMAVVNNEILRRHFLELTTNFLAPFGPYFKAKAPSEGSSPYVDPPPLPLFNAEEFLSNLLGRGPGKFLLKRMTSNWVDLYRRFLKGNNFSVWFQRKRSLIEKEQYRAWRQARMKSDIQLFISKVSELEVVDTFNAIERHLLREMQVPNVDSKAVCIKMKRDLYVVFSALPLDIQQLLQMNPGRAALLQETLDGVDIPGDSQQELDLRIDANSEYR